MTPDAVLNEDQKRIRFRKVNQKRQMLSRRGQNSSARVSERIVVEDVGVVDDDEDDNDDGGGDDSDIAVHDIVDDNVVENDDGELLTTTLDRETQPVQEADNEIYEPSNQEIIKIQCPSEDEEMASVPDNEIENIRECSLENEPSSLEVPYFVNYSSDKFMTGIRSVVQSYQVLPPFRKKSRISFFGFVYAKKYSEVFNFKHSHFLGNSTVKLGFIF